MPARARHRHHTTRRPQQHGGTRIARERGAARHTVYGARVDRLVNQLVRFAALIENSRAAAKRVLHEKGEGRDERTVLAADACVLVDICEACELGIAVV
eukprot:4460669-Prymnesium_polylepis.1